VGSLGVYSFTFAELGVRRRLGRAVQTGPGEWDYFDIETSQPFDFYRPFET
jgi:hypothetical protein